MTSAHQDGSFLRRPSRSGLWLRIAASAAMVTLAALSAGRMASASFDQPSLPIGDVASLDGIVSGTVLLTGDRLAFYSGDRFQSNQSSLALNFAGGGSLVLCPHSQLQILAADQNSGVMLAFQEGGSQQPFVVRAHDVVMTPDWRIQMMGDVPSGGSGSLQVSTSRRGELCLSGSAKAGQYFRVSQLIGDSVFDVTGQSSIRISDGHIENSPGGCACETSPSGVISTGPTAAGAISAPTTGGTPWLPPASATAAPVAARPVESASSVPAVPPQSGSAPAENLAPPSQKNQRPQDVAGYVRSFIHVLFGR